MPTENFHTLRAKIKKDYNLPPGEAAKAAMKERPDLYAQYLEGLGVINPARASFRANRQRFL